MAGWRELNQGLQQQWQRSFLLQRWQALPTRDRLALTLLACFILLVLLYLLLWQPLQRSVQAAREGFAEQRELYAYIQSRAPTLQGRNPEPRSNPDPARLQGLVTVLAAEQGLVIERLDAGGLGVIEVSLQPLPFGQLLGWLEMLEAQGVRVEEAGLDRRNEGRVAASLSLRTDS